MADLRSVFSGFDLDSGAGTELIAGVSLRLTASGGSIEALGQQLSAASIPVVLASDQSALTIDTELPAAAALTDNFATPTAPAVGAFGLMYDGAAWDMLRGTAADGVLVNLGANNDVTVTGTVTVDTELVAAALADNFANPTIPGVGAFAMIFDGSAWDRAPGTTTDGLLVNLGANNDVSVTGTVTVDTELAAAALLTDNFATPTVPGVGAFGLMYDGAAWDMVRGTAADGLLVNLGANNDVSFTPAVPTSPVTDYVSSSAVAAGASADLDTAEAAAKKLRQVNVWSSVAYRARVYLVNNSVEASEPVATGGGQAYDTWTYNTPHPDYAALGTTAGADTFRVEFTNLDDANAADAHATFAYES